MFGLPTMKRDENMAETQNITIIKKENSLLTLNTANKYIEDDIKFNINVQPAESTLNVSLASNLQQTPAEHSGKNIAEIFGEKTLTEPNAGYFIRLQTANSSNVTLQQGGWLNQDDIPAQTIYETSYYPVSEATFNSSGVLNVTPATQLSQTNVVFSDIDNGIKVTANSQATGTINATFSTTKAGYIEQYEEHFNDTQSNSDTVSQFISGVSIPIPSADTKSFSIQLPDGNTFIFSVDSNGNAFIE